MFARRDLYDASLLNSCLPGVICMLPGMIYSSWTGSHIGQINIGLGFGWVGVGRVVLVCVGWKKLMNYRLELV